MKTPTRPCASRSSRRKRSTTQTPLFRLPTTLEISDGPGKTRVVPIVIDGASHEFVIPAATRPKMVQIDPQGWLIKELDFEKADEENLFQLEHAACVLGRLDAAQGTGQDGERQARSRRPPWPRPGSGKKQPPAQTRDVELMCNGDEIFRAALIEAAGRLRSPRPRRRDRRAGQAQA